MIWFSVKYAAHKLHTNFIFAHKLIVLHINFIFLGAGCGSGKKQKLPRWVAEEKKSLYLWQKKWCYLLMISKHQPNKKLQPYRAGASHYLRRLLVLRAFGLGVTLTVIVTGTVTLRVVREGLFFFFVAIGIYLLVIKIVLQGSWIYRVLPCMLFCSYSYFCLAFWCCIRLCALRQNSVRDTLGSLIYLRLFDKTLRLLLQWCSYSNKLLRIHWFVWLGAS